MLWFSSPELDLCLGLIMIIVFGLYSLRNKHVYLNDIYFFSRCWPLLLIVSYYIDGVDLNLFSSYLSSSSTQISCDFYYTALSNGSLDILLCLLTFFILQSFKSFESVLLIMLAFIGQLGLMHSCDLVSFYVCLEMQNFCFLVLCGLQPESTMGKKGNSGFSVEASIKFMLLSAFSSGIILFFFAALYLRTGTSHLFFKSASLEFNSQLESFMILLAMMFKLGAAPLHLWVVDIYTSVKRPLLMYINTAPKLSLFAFWVNAWHSVWTDFTVGLFVCFSMLLGSFGAYGQPALRALFAYSTINEIGLMLLAIETAGFHSLFQHLFIYIVTQLLLWNLSDKRLFSLIAVSLAGLPPLAGFFGKMAIFLHVSTQHAIFLLSVALLTTCVSLVYYLRVIRLFWSKPSATTTVQLSPMYVRSFGITSASILNTGYINHSFGILASPTFTRVNLTSSLVIFLIFAPFFLIKPFVL